MNRMMIPSLLLGLLVSGAAFAQDDTSTEPLVCEAPREVDRYQLLRRLSLDLRGHLPTYEEYLSLDGAADVPAATIRQFIESDAFRAEMRRHHESFLWPNVSNVGVSDFTYQIAARGAANGRAWARGNMTWSRRQRNIDAVDPETGVRPPFQYCGDFEQTEFDPAYPGEYRLLPTPAGQTTPRIEGWRWVSPYWDPENPIKVCAFDAQETEFPGGTTMVNGIPDTPRSCADRSGANHFSCGCGPNLRWCSPGRTLFDGPVKDSMREQFGRMVDDATSTDRPYTDILLSKRVWENGPISWYTREFAPVTSPGQVFTAPEGEYPEQARAFVDDTWEVRERAGVHAGILTLPAYLLRFQTQRGRANRLLEAFACEPYVAPASLTPRPGCSVDSEDLTQRCFCQSCHSALEPAAAAFGYFVEQGTTMATDPVLFPPVNEACIGSGNAFCRRFYVTDRNSPAAGKLRAFEFEADHRDFPGIIEAGPAGLAQRLINDGTFARCTVRRLFTRLLKRDLLIDERDDRERELLEQLAGEFAASDFDFQALVERLVTLPEYRRAR